MKEENSYRKILKGTTLFGGVQMFQILVGLVRGKFVAMFLGPAGMGVASMFTSASNTISRFASLGLNLSFVKEVAAVKEDEEQLATVGRLSAMLLRFTATLGAVACVLLAPWLSRISFESTEYSWQFMLLGVAVFFTVAGEGKMALLQGLHKVKVLSATSLAGAVTGLIAGVPLYYFFGTRGIVPAMIILSLTTFSFYSLGLRKAMPSSKPKLSRKLHSPLVRHMLAMGVTLLAANLINTGCTYAINIFVNLRGDMADVGLFNAANSITLQYAGVVFTAMSLDYFPRLSAAAANHLEMKGIVNKQMEIVALVAAPLSILLVALAPLVIRVLLTPEFLPATELMRWLAISILLKAVSYPLGLISFAKDNRRLFFWLEGVVCNALYLGLSVGFYYAFGFMGLGYAAVTEQACCVILYLVVNWRVYGLKPNRAAVLETIVALMLGAAGFCASIVTESALTWWLMGSVFLISAGRSFIALRSRWHRE